MPMLKKYIGDLFFTRRFYAALTVCAVLFIIRFFISWLGVIPYIATLATIVLVVVDYIFLFANGRGMYAVRHYAERFSNGDENPVRIDIESYYNLPVHVEVVDEIPHQFQRRDVQFEAALAARGKKTFPFSTAGQRACLPFLYTDAEIPVARYS